MKTIAMILLLACCGCMSGRAKSQKTLAGIQYVADATMKMWGSYVAREQKRADTLPDGAREEAHGKLLERRLKVDDARRKFSAAWTLAFAAADYDGTEPAIGQVLPLFTDLETTIQVFTR